ncbi:hypothetical protein PIROE2DRAFT_8923 [Piromyces sp. E2]|nr:hypothetical protein PIROE2DRAFT_8923 [Piromyces sp. E2]|eukprot:OUM64304.1 hypothetical protein PIROE2DRAFT_8923 [Piromyces sp. E2]
MNNKRIFKTDPLSATKPTDLFVSSNVDNSYNYLSTKGRDYFLYSNDESLNQKVSSFNPNRMSNDFIHPYQDNINLINKDQYFVTSSSLSSEPLLLSQSNNVGSLPRGLPPVADLRNPILDSTRANNEFGYGQNVYLEEDVNDLQEANGIDQGNAYYPEYQQNLTLPPFRTQNYDGNLKDNSKNTFDSVSVYSKASHARTVSKGSFYFGNLSTPKLKRISAKSISSFFEANRMSFSAASTSNYSVNPNNNNNRKSTVNRTSSHHSQHHSIKNNKQSNNLPQNIVIPHKSSNVSMKAESPLSLFNRSYFSPYPSPEKSFEKLSYDKSFDKSLFEKSFDKSVENSIDNSIEKSMATSVEPSVEVSMEPSMEFPAEKSIEKSLDSSLINGEDIDIQKKISSMNINTGIINPLKDNNL